MATSLVASVIDLYNSISATHFGGTRPPVYLGESPPVASGGAQQRPPYVVLNDDGFRPEFDSSFGGIERGDIRLEVYALKLDAVGEVTVDSIVRGIKWGGSAPSAKAGLDFGAFALTGYNYKIHLLRTLERRSYAGFDYQGQRVHKCELNYACVLGLSPT